MTKALQPWTAEWHEANCCLYSAETLAYETTKTGARGFYARAEMTKRGIARTLEE